MKDTPSDDGRAERPDAKKDAQPWHPADEKRKGGGAPVGTHSLTGGGAEVGMPASPEADAGIERGRERTDADAASEPDPLAEPRASIGEILGRKP